MISGNRSKKPCVLTVVIVQRIAETSWRLFFGNCVQAQLGVIFQKNYALGKRRITALIVGRVKVYGRNFF